MAESYSEAEIDEFIRFLIKKYPNYLKDVFLYWEKLRTYTDKKLMALVTNQRIEAIKDYQKLGNIPHALEITSIFQSVVMDRIYQLQQNGQIDSSLGTDANQGLERP